MKRHLVPLLLLLVVILLAPLAAPWDPERSLDPALLRLVPPATPAMMLLLEDGSVLPVASGVAALSRGTRPFSVEGGDVVYARGRRIERRPLEDFVLDPQGRPVFTVRWLWAGTDGFGRDLLSRTLFGLRLSVLIALGAVLGSSLLAALAGLAGGLAGRLLDSMLAVTGDALLSVPRIVLVMALAVAIRPSAVMLAVVLAATGWPAMARLVRGEVRRMRASDTVLAARATGASAWRVAFVHVLPEALVTLAIAAGLRIAPTILLEASLSFLGAGVRPPAASLGTILAEGRELLLEAWWVSTIPGLVLVAVVLAISGVVDRFQQRMERP